MCVELALVEFELDKEIFGRLIKLYGFQRDFRDGKTTHLVLLSDKFSQSKKLQQIKRFKQPPEVVG